MVVGLVQSTVLIKFPENGNHQLALFRLGCSTFGRNLPDCHRSYARRNLEVLLEDSALGDSGRRDSNIDVRLFAICYDSEDIRGYQQNVGDSRKRTGVVSPGLGNIMHKSDAGNKREPRPRGFVLEVHEAV